jgi:hypothetical protein
MPQARGTFEVRLEPQAPGEIEEPTLGRMTIDKQFMGDLAGSSKGQMLSVARAVSCCNTAARWIAAKARSLSPSCPTAAATPSPDCAAR